jgi:SOS response regulatory protein OraA/RecX
MLPAPAISFNYNALPAATAASLRKQAARIREGVKATTAAIIEVGRGLIAAKQDLEHNQFCEWVEKECVFSVRSAQNYMRAAEFAEGKNATVALLQPATFYKLAAKSAPPEIVQEVIDRAAKGEVVSDRGVIAALNEAKFQKRETEAKQRLATRRKTVSKRTLAKNEARQREEEAAAKQDEQWRLAALSIIDTIGEAHARFLVRTLDEADYNRGHVLRHLEAEVAKLAAVQRDYESLKVTTKHQIEAAAK